MSNSSRTSLLEPLRSVFPVGSRGICSTRITSSGVLNRATLFCSNQRPHISTEKSARHDHRGDLFAEPGMRYTRRRNLGHDRVAGTSSSISRSRDVLARSDDDVLDAADDGQPAVVIYRTRSPVRNHRPRSSPRGLLLRGQVAGEQLRSAHEKLALSNQEFGLADGVTIERTWPIAGRPRRPRWRRSGLRWSHTSASPPRRARVTPARRTRWPRPAPPDDTSRSDSTRRLEKAGSDIRSTKNVGGPIMNDTRSRSMRSSAIDGDHRSSSTVVIPAAAATRMPFSRPEM